jgi:hypothetical protein
LLFFWFPAIYRTQKTQNFQMLINAKSLWTQKFSSSHTQCEQIAGGLIIWSTNVCLGVGECFVKRALTRRRARKCKSSRIARALARAPAARRISSPQRHPAAWTGWSDQGARCWHALPSRSCRGGRVVDAAAAVAFGPSLGVPPACCCCCCCRSWWVWPAPSWHQHHQRRGEVVSGIRSESTDRLNRSLTQSPPRRRQPSSRATAHHEPLHRCCTLQPATTATMVPVAPPRARSPLLAPWPAPPRPRPSPCSISWEAGGCWA